MLFNIPFFTLLHNIVSLALGIFGFGFLIFFHELGHFLFAKLFNVLTPSFSIGFGPTLWSKKIGETQFSVSAILIGGYVEIAGNEEIGQGSQAEAHRQDERSITSKPFWQQFLIMIGGILLNLILAFCIFTFLSTRGIPQDPGANLEKSTTKLSFVDPKGPAGLASLKAGDTITALNGAPTHGRVCTLCTLLEGKMNSDVQLTIKRGEQTLIIPVHLIESPKAKGRGHLGVGFSAPALPPQSFLSALGHAWRITGAIAKNTVKAFLGIISGRGLSSVGGPIMILAAMTKGAQQDSATYLLILAIISIGLAIINLVPLPIFDGGQILIFGIEALMGRRLSDRARTILGYACWILVISLFVLLSIKDLYQIITTLNVQTICLFSLLIGVIALIFLTKFIIQRRKS
ncbi:MAG: site-2 protease family protein [Candidatus Babeliaceae bacterium]|nr:site-2 protease family protein [Candidatus Babeliaceae bacterium]